MDYLVSGFLVDGQLRQDLEAGALATARQWMSESVDFQAIECSAELLARVAERLDGQAISRVELSVAFDEPVRSLLNAALPDPVPSVHAAAAAVHVLDIAEHMALEVYLAELPSLLARANRTGDAARNVGIARHLKG